MNGRARLLVVVSTERTMVINKTKTTKQEIQCPFNSLSPRDKEKTTTFLDMMVVKQQDKFPREVEESPPIGMFKIKLQSHVQPALVACTFYVLRRS